MLDILEPRLYAPDRPKRLRKPEGVYATTHIMPGLSPIPDLLAANAGRKRKAVRQEGESAGAKRQKAIAFEAISNAAPEAKTQAEADGVVRSSKWLASYPRTPKVKVTGEKVMAKSHEAGPDSAVTTRGCPESPEATGRARNPDEATEGAIDVSTEDTPLTAPNAVTSLPPHESPSQAASAPHHQIVKLRTPPQAVEAILSNLPEPARFLPRSRQAPDRFGSAPETPEDRQQDLYSDSDSWLSELDSGLFSDEDTPVDRRVSKSKEDKRRVSETVPGSTTKATDSTSKSKLKPARINTSLPTPVATPPGLQCDEDGESLLNTVDPDTLEESRDLVRREALGSKPQPSGKPEVWADSRQALCETVPYFKKPQGGCHQNDGHVYAFLFDGVGHCREYMGAEVIISRAGGGMESDNTGNMVQSKDHSMSEAQPKAVVNNIRLQNPLIMICGNKSTGALCAMPHKYCVLGWYKPIMVWAEKTAGKGKKNWVTFKYRFEWMTGQGKPWHAPHNTARLDGTAAQPALRRTCQDCEQTFPQIYLESWLCLDAECENFWRLANGQEAPAGKLTFNPAFLHEKTPWRSEEPPYSVTPPLPDTGRAIGDARSYIMTRGIVCPECGRCNQRYLWQGWQCGNPACSWEGLSPHQDPIMPVSLHAPWEVVGDGPSLARNKHEDTVSLDIQHAFGYKIYIYSFVGIEGHFVHAVANRKITSESRGPDDMLYEMQVADMGLERRRFGGGKTSADMKKSDVDAVNKGPDTPSATVDTNDQLRTPQSEMPTSHQLTDTNATQEQSLVIPADNGDFMTAFSMNYGMPYKFVASGASQCFENAPWPVRECRSRLKWAAKEFLSTVPNKSDFADLNELLILAYMEGQKIDYHDDGEEGLGPRITTLSLGGRAKMHLRMKSKHYTGCSKGTGILTDDRPLPGSLEYEARLGLREELSQLKISDRAAFYRRMKQIPKELGVYERRNKSAKDLVEVTLNHGDIVIMDGYEIQRFLEHKVVPVGRLRFALTCRTVLEGHLGEGERPEYLVQPDKGVYLPLMAA
ncbi:hypothetical protein LTR62_003840 [Meristemomyces frigidus]|uniref:Alpha-ketoglutarate-dependent dioxygenase AlkB-like domain-containing protein n=1 Tax=Meristemomyces frigidus TaxID=1508187 RepID=A0AAN7THY3_9PEZI|nr:hypothetical protein LTR62_003840 [Meristemomyces frigidus]